MFVNFSNHPSSCWGAEQLREAQKYGTVRDVPFPNVLPEATAEEVLSLARNSLDVIQREFGDTPFCECTVHIAGELNLCYYLIQLLVDSGYRVVTSTTARIVEVLPDNSINKKFMFTQFRTIINKITDEDLR